MQLSWHRFVTATLLVQAATSLVIRAEDQSLDDGVPGNGPPLNSSLDVNADKTLLSLNGSSSLGEGIPPDFHIGVVLKKGGKLFYKYDCWQALVKYAAALAEREWEEDIASVSCDSFPKLGIKFTSNKPPLPMYQTRTLMWSIFHLFNWWADYAKAETPKWQELNFFTFLDDETRLGIGNVYAKGEQGWNSNQGADGNTTSDIFTRTLAKSSNELSITNGSLQSDVGVPVPSGMQPSLNRDFVNVGIGYIKNGKLVCSDILYYRTILELLILIGERDVEASIGQGVQLYNPIKDFTFSVHATSSKAGEEGILKNWMVLRALSVIATMMEREPGDLRFHEHIANIVTGPASSAPRGTRVVGKIIFVKGKRFSDEPLDAEVTAANVTEYGEGALGASAVQIT